MRILSSQANAHSNERALVCQAQERSFSPTTSLRSSTGLTPRCQKTSLDEAKDVGLPSLSKTSMVMPATRSTPLCSFHLFRRSYTHDTVLIAIQTESHIFHLSGLFFDRNSECLVRAFSLNL